MEFSASFRCVCNKWSINVHDVDIYLKTTKPSTSNFKIFVLNSINNIIVNESNGKKVKTKKDLKNIHFNFDRDRALVFYISQIKCTSTVIKMMPTQAFEIKFIKGQNHYTYATMARTNNWTITKTSTRCETIVNYETFPNYVKCEIFYMTGDQLLTWHHTKFLTFPIAAEVVALKFVPRFIIQHFEVKYPNSSKF